MENFQYFKYSDFTCRCGCGLNNQSIPHIKKLDIARGIAGIPFVVTCGYRCQRHNEEVGGSETSSHLIGHATDILADTPTKRYRILSGLIRAGFERIEIGYKKAWGDKTKQWIHVDDDISKSQGVLWIET